MKVMAKENLGYSEYSYVNWEKGNSYPCELSDDGKRLDVTDKEGVVFHFSGKAKENLKQVFKFVS